MRRIFGPISLAALAGFLIFGAGASAHEFILKAVPTAEGKIIVDAVASHAFLARGEAEPLKDVDVVLLQEGKKTPVTLSGNDAGKCLTGMVAPGKGPAMLIGHRKPQYWSDTTKDVQAGTRADLEAKGVTVLSVGRYEKFAKALLHATPADTTVFGAVLGQPLEIVLLTNPADIKAGGTVRCRVLRDGKPLATEVGAGYDGFSTEDDKYAVRTTSNAKGEAEFIAPAAGLWFIRVAVTEKISAPDADKVNLRATYAFEIQ